MGTGRLGVGLVVGCPLDVRKSLLWHLEHLITSRCPGDFGAGGLSGLSKRMFRCIQFPESIL